MIVLHVQKVAGISGSEAHLLQLLPALKSRGWDIRFLMLHEHEPGAWDFARELTSRGIPLDSISLAADVDPFAFLRLAGYLARRRPMILHTHPMHADVYGQLAGALTAVPLRVSTKHGFNAFRENPGFALGDRAIATFAHTHIAISLGRPPPLADRGLPRVRLRGHPLRDRGARRAGGAFRGPPRFLCIGRCRSRGTSCSARVPCSTSGRRAARHRRPRRARAWSRTPREPASTRRVFRHDARPGRDRGVARGRRASLARLGMVALEAMERAARHRRVDRRAR